MTQLNCSVTSCLYNQDHYCSKDDITVGGSNAKRTSDTCCAIVKIPNVQIFAVSNAI